MSEVTRALNIKLISSGDSNVAIDERLIVGLDLQRCPSTLGEIRRSAAIYQATDDGKRSS